MKPLLFIDTCILLENTNVTNRVNQYIQGLGSIFKHNDFFIDNNFDIILVDNTVDDIDDIEKATNVKIKDIIPKNVNVITKKQNNYGKINKGAGCFEHWSLVPIELYKKYDYIIVFEARQTLKSKNFFDAFIENPTTIFSWSRKCETAKTGNFVKNDPSMVIENYGLNIQDINTHPSFNDFYTGLFSMEMTKFLELNAKTGSKYLIDESISLEKIMMRFVYKECDKFTIIDYVDIIRYIPISNSKEHH